MIHHAVSPATEGDDQQRPLILSRAAITTDHIRRFVSILMHEFFEREGLRYDAVYIALAESGIQPQPSMQCERVHFDSRVDRQNVLADALIETIASDEVIRAAMTRLTDTILHRLTVPAPDKHLSEADLAAFLVCCLPTADCEHMAEDEAHAVLHAHLGTCPQCDRRLREKCEATGARRERSRCFQSNLCPADK